MPKDGAAVANEAPERVAQRSDRFCAGGFASRKVPRARRAADRRNLVEFHVVRGFDAREALKAIGCDERRIERLACGPLRRLHLLPRGGAIKGNRLDVLFPTHEEALVWGVRDLEVTVWEYADGEPNGFREYHWSWKKSR